MANQQTLNNMQEQEFDIYSVAYENGLDVIETTTDGTGYPKNLKQALIGFSTFNEAELLAEKYGLRITTFHKKDGWMLWVRTGNSTYEPFQIDSSYYGDNYNVFYASSVEDFYDNEVKPLLDSFETFDELEAFIQQKRELFGEIQDMYEDQVVVAHEGQYYETINRVSMGWYHDTNRFEIGLIQD